jgi:hypothetical protein
MRRAIVLGCCLAIVACKSSTAPPTPTQVAFIAQPSNTVAGQTIAPRVQVAIEDASGHVVTTAASAVTIALGSNAAGGVLQGTLTAASVHGVASFSSLVLNKAGTNYTLTAAASTFPTVTSKAFTIMPGPASQLVFTVQPTLVPAGQAMNPAVQVTALDAESNVASGFTGAMSLALGTNPTAATLNGTLTATAVAGQSTFPNLTISNQGTGYTLVAAAGSLGATSLAFNVGTTGIQYHGGPIIYTPRIAALYWSSSVIYNGGPTPGTHGTPPTADGSIVGFFLNNLGGSPYYNITASYLDATNTHVQNVAAYTQYWADASGPASSTPTDSAIHAEIESGFTSGTLTYDPNTMYAVFTGTGVNLGGGFGTQYCAYHSFFVDGQGRNVKYAAMPYANDYIATTTTPGCSVTSPTEAGSPNSDPAADAEVNVLSHEFAETITDENGTAWWVTSTGDELGDLCNFQFGTMFNANGALANQSLGGKYFLVQTLWVNAETSTGAPVGCQQNWTSTGSHPARVPVVAFKSAPAPTRHIMRMRTTRF